MPCIDDRDYIRREDQREVEQLRNRNDLLARLLCEATKIVFENKSQVPSSNLRDWYIKHSEFDRLRKSRKLRKDKDRDIKKHIAPLIKGKI